MEREYWYVAAAGILLGFLVFGAATLSKMGLSLYQISIFFSLFGTISLLPLILYRKEYRPNRKMFKQFAIYGFVGLLLNFSDFGSVILGAPVALAVLLIYTQPLWTVIFGRIFLKEAITRSNVIAIIMVLAGASILVNPFSISSAASPAGIILALLGGVLVSMWVILGRYFGKLKYSPVTTLFGYISSRFLFTLISFPIILLFTKSPSITEFSMNLPADTWIYLIAYALVAGTASHLLYYAGARKVPASTAGVILLLEPLSGAILAALFLAQAITLNILVGGAFILAANYLVVRKSKSKK